MLALANLPAQRVAMPDGRVLQMFDLRQTQHGGDTNLAPMPRDANARAVSILRHFIEPSLRQGDDIQAIGPHWIAVIADAERIASVDRIFEAAKQHRDDLLTIEIRMLDVKPDTFRSKLQKSLAKVARQGGDSWEAVIAKDKAEAFWKTSEAAADALLAAPKLCVQPLQLAQVSVVNQVSYVKDFTVQRSKDAVIADPVIATTWDGHKSEVCATFLPDGRIGLSCSVHVQELHRPIDEIKTTVFPGTAPVTIQLPRTSGVRLANVAEFTPGSLVVLASQRTDGNYLVAIIKASATGNR